MGIILQNIFGMIFKKKTFFLFIASYYICRMQVEKSLRLVKIIHTLIWIFFNVVIFYMLYAVIINKIDKWLWIGYGLVVLEGITLLVFKGFCPLTIIARKYSDSDKDNFDIYLPNWLARFNKQIYMAIMFIIFILTIYQLVKAAS